MSTQYAQPLSCDARIRISSRRGGSMPASLASFVVAPSRREIAPYTPEATFS
jgi:hypothetical protein